MARLSTGHISLAFALAHALALAWAPARAQAPASPPPPPLPADGFASVNMVDLLWSYAGYSAGNSTYAREMMGAACGATRGLRFVRYAALPFWPAQLNATLLADPRMYWALHDSLVEDAAAAGCMLMPSLFWMTFAFADAFGERAGVVFDEALGPSRARDAMENFTAAFVARYSGSSAIAAWELGNENNLLWDINMTEQQPDVCAACGTPPFRTSADNISTAGGVAVQARLAAIVRANDPSARLVSSGHAMARPDATWLRESFRAPRPPPLYPDTLPQFLATTALQQAGVGLMSQHIYPGADNERFGIADPYSPAVLAFARQAAAAAGQVLLVGEFGDGAPGNRTFTRNVLALFADWRGRPDPAAAPFFGAVWDFMLLQQADSFALFPGRDDAIIDAIVAHNRAGEP